MAKEKSGDPKAGEVTAWERVVGASALRGSERQVSWARRIRHDRVLELSRLLGQACEAYADGPEREEAKRQASEATRCVLAVAGARWWIEHRDDDVLGLPDAALEADGRRRGRR